MTAGCRAAPNVPPKSEIFPHQNFAFWGKQNTLFSTLISMQNFPPQKYCLSGKEYPSNFFVKYSYTILEIIKNVNKNATYSIIDNK